MSERSSSGRSRGQFLLLLPALIPVVVLSLIPLLRGVYLGFTDYQLGDPIRFNGLANYVRMAQDVFFWKSFQVGILWTLIVTAGQVALGLILALLLNRKVRFTSWYAALMLVPWAMPPIIRGIVWRQVYDPDAGILSSVLLNAGILHERVNWLSDFSLVIPAVVVAGVWGEIPKVAVFLLVGLQAIPKDLYEAVRMDGASRWKEFRHITLPMLGPVMAAIVSLSFMWNFNTFGIVWVLTQGGPGGLTRLPMLAAYEEAFRYGYVGYAAAIGNVMVVVISVVLYGYLRVQLKENRA